MTNSVNHTGGKIKDSFRSLIQFRYVPPIFISIILLTGHFLLASWKVMRLFYSLLDLPWPLI